MGRGKLLVSGSCIVAVAVVLAGAGCATLHAASADGRQIRDMLRQWKTACKAQDVQAMMRLYADDYNHKEKNKAGVERVLAEYMKENAPYDVCINIDDATVTVRGNRATVMPIALSGIAGSDTARLELTKRGGLWWITGTDL